MLAGFAQLSAVNLLAELRSGRDEALHCHACMRNLSTYWEARGRQRGKGIDAIGEEGHAIGVAR